MLPIRLNELRKKNHMTQAELAKKINVAKSTISMWEKGVRSPDTTTLGKLADIFHVSTDYLLGKTNNSSPINAANSSFDIDDDIPLAYHGKSIPDEYLEIIKKLMDSDLRKGK